MGDSEKSQEKGVTRQVTAGNGPLKQTEFTGNSVEDTVDRPETEQGRETV